MRNVKTKLWLFITILVVAIMGFVYVFQIYLLSEAYLAKEKEKLLLKGENIVTVIQKNELTEEEKKTALIQAIRGSDIRFMLKIIDKNGVDRSDSILGNILSGIYQEFKVKALEKNPSQLERIFAFRDSDQDLSLLLPIDEEFSLEIKAVVPSLGQTELILKKQFFYAFILSLLLGTGAALGIARYFTKPILNIDKRTEGLINGDFETRLSLDNQDEIGRLAEKINILSRKLQENERMQKEFLANTSHELKTPLSLIQAYAEMTQDFQEDQKGVYENQELIIKETQHLNKMVEDMLYLSKMEAKEEFLAPKDFCLDEMLGALINKFEILAKNHGKEIVFKKDSQDSWSEGDVKKLERAFANLLTNAIYHSNSEEIKVFLQEEEKDYKVFMQNKSHKISASALDKIWNRFYKNEEQGCSRGTGLGMSIVKKIFDLHGFSYGLDFENEKNEFSVWVILPKKERV